MRTFQYTHIMLSSLKAVDDILIQKYIGLHSSNTSQLITFIKSIN